MEIGLDIRGLHLSFVQGAAALLIFLGQKVGILWGFFTAVARECYVQRGAESRTFFGTEADAQYKHGMHHERDKYREHHAVVA